MAQQGPYQPGPGLLVQALTTVLPIVTTIVLGTLWLSTQFSAFELQLHTLRLAAEQQNVDLAWLRSRLRNRALINWHRTDQRIWCAETERRNPGFKCPDPSVSPPIQLEDDKQ